MPIEAKAQIVIKGGPESLKVLQGVKRGTSDVAREAKKAAQETERWQKLAWKSADARMRADEKAARATAKAAELAARAQQKAARDTQRVQTKAAQEAAKAAEKAQRDAVRAAEKAQRELDKLAQKEADRWRQLAAQSARYAEQEAAKRIAEAKKTAASEAQSRRDSLRRAGGLIGAATAGVLAGGMVAASTARGIAGVKDIRERITSANDFRERLVRVSNDAGFSSAQRESVQGQVLATSKSTGMGIDELMGVLEAGQGQFNNLQYFADQLESIGRIAKASGADAKTLALAMGFANQAFGMTGEAAEESGYLMKAAANIGSVEVNDLANAFAPVAGIFAETTKHKGQSGYKEFLGLAETMNTGGFGAEGSATRAESFLKAISGVDTQKKLAGIGVKGFVGKDGSIDIPMLIEKLATSKKFSSASVRQGIFEDVRAQQGVETLVAARRRVQEGVAGAVDMNTFQSLEASTGKSSVDSGMREMQGEGFFKMQQEAARMQAETVENLGSLNSQVLSVAQAADRLESAFGSLSLWANSIAAVGLVGGAVNTVGNLANAGAGGGALAKALPSVANAGATIAGGAQTALAAGSVTVGAAGAAVATGAALAAGAVGAAIGYGINELTSAVRSDDKTLSDLLSDALFEAFNKNDARFQQGSRIENMSEDGTKRLVTVMEANNKKLESIDQGLRTANTKPDPGAPRGPR